MRRSTWALALIAVPTLLGAHTGDHSVMSAASGLAHAFEEHWGWLCVVALLAIVHAIGSSRKSRASKGRAKRPPIQ